MYLLESNGIFNEPRDVYLSVYLYLYVVTNRKESLCVSLRFEKSVRHKYATNAEKESHSVFLTPVFFEASTSFSK